MSTHTGVDYFTRPRTPEDVDDIEVAIECLDGHDVAIADSIHP
jgi:hypothetical protein